jgi:hypothetical protein
VFSAFETPLYNGVKHVHLSVICVASTWGHHLGDPNTHTWVHRVSVCDIWVFHICMIPVLCEVHLQKCKLLHFWKRPSYKIAISI